MQCTGTSPVPLGTCWGLKWSVVAPTTFEYDITIGLVHFLRAISKFITPETVDIGF